MVDLYEIHINLTTRQLTLLYGGNTVAIYPVAIGKPSTPTPTGNFTILNKIVNPGGAFGTRWMAFTHEGHGIHGTNDPSSIGKAVSMGCVRMHNRDIEEIFPLISLGTPVEINY
ncbi:MAG TPA: L,D-transpeptidase [Clostridia bacterium]|nr:L,D-transpeptidase [Clostridia bacterium]